MPIYDKSFNDNGYDNPSSVSAPVEPVAEVVPQGSPAAQRFQSCRWRKAAENGLPECCGHRDVLPLTGANGFDAEAWCPECAYYKLRRTPKKRDYYEDRY